MPKFSRVHEYQQGQILLIIVLVMIVALTIGLSVVTRSVTNLQISKEEESSQRALSAAEAGIERALEGSTNNVSLGNNASIKNVKVTDIQGTQFLVNNGNPILRDDGADIWLSTVVTDPATKQKTYNGKFNGKLQIFWGNPNESCSDVSSLPAAVEILVIDNDPVKGSPRITHYPIDPCNPTRVTYNNFCTVNNTTGTCPLTNEYTSESDQSAVKGTHFRYATTLDITNGIMARVVPIYASTVLGVKNLSDDVTKLPLQGTVIESTGASGTTERKVSVYKGFAKVPIEFFPYILFSPQ